MNDLTNLPPSALPAKTTSLALSQPLRLLLEAERSGDDAVNGIVNSPALHAECKAALPAIMDRIKGCGMVGVRDVIGRRFATYPQPDRSDMEWAAWWADYCDALEDVPYEALEGGMRAWVQKPESQFMPKPGELRALALKAGEPLYQAASRARRVAHLPLRRFGPLDDEQPVSADDRKALAAEILASLQPKTMTTNQEGKARP